MIAQAIVDRATEMWKEDDGDYRDDITVIVLKLPWLPTQLLAVDEKS